MNVKEWRWRHPIEEAEIQAYIDGLLDRERRLEVEAYLAARPDEAARVESYRQQVAALHARYDAILCESLPPSVEAVLRRCERAGRKQRGWRMAWQVAVCLVLLVIGGAAGWWGHGNVMSQQDKLVAFAQQAAEAHLLIAEKNAPPSDFRAENRSKFGSWVASQLRGGPSTVPDLESVGYRVVQARALPAAGGVAIQLIYANAEGEPLSLFITPESGAARASFSFIRQGEISFVSWSTASFLYGLVGNLDRDKLVKLAQVITESINNGQEAQQPEAPGDPGLQAPSDDPIPVQTKTGESVPGVLPAEKTSPDGKDGAAPAGGTQPEDPALLPSPSDKDVNT